MTDKAKKALEEYKKMYNLLKSGEIADPATGDDTPEVKFVECAKESPKKPIMVINEGIYNIMDLQDQRGQIIKIKAEEHEQKQIEKPEESKERNI